MKSLLQFFVCWLILPLLIVGNLAVVNFGEEAVSAGSAETETAETSSVTEKKHALPNEINKILKTKCSACHSGEEAEGKLDVDSFLALMVGGEAGEAIVPGKPEKSLFWTKIESNEMPPEDEDPLTKAEKKRLQQWIAKGEFPTTKEIQKLRLQHLTVEAQKHWAFRPLQKPTIPVVKNQDWSDNPIDQFVLARLEKEKLKPGKNADSYTLLRRVYFDLIGLPPSEQEIASFLHDIDQMGRQQALEKVIDRLLASVEFGERWGRHWLDVVRYSDTLGGGANFTLNDAWRYRDYVIRSFNEDKPYHRFVTEQIAGDLLPYTSAQQREEQLIATGFLAIGPKDFTDQDKVKLLADSIDEQLDTLGKTFMGLAIGCARCHGHKFDPIPMEDYYALTGILRSTQTLEELDDSKKFSNMPRWNRILLPTISKKQKEEIIEKNKAERKSLQKKSNALKKQIATLKKQMPKDSKSKNAVAGQISVLERSKRKIDGELGKKNSFKNYFGEPFPSILGVVESKKQLHANINLGGNPRQLGKEIPRGVIRAIGKECATIPENQSGRLQLAQWLASPEHPLTARVMTNRVWSYLFGRGIVQSIDNFGTRGSKPSHPKLLDYLSIQFMKEGWSVKKLIRRIMLSRVYQLASIRNSAAVQLDPDNKLLWKRTTRRLDVEALRDSLLQLSGELSHQRGGPTLVHAGTLSLGFLMNIKRAGLWKRRSVYLPVYRSTVIENKAMMPTFDFADPNFVVGHRTSSIVPTQALFLMNNKMALNSAEALSRKLLKELPDDNARIRSLYLSILGRPVREHERTRAQKFIELSIKKLSEKEKPEKAQQIVWASFVQVMFSSSEFLLIN